ncbi:hypothetical protein B9Z19DRAFT_1062398 [Tuber borchii]|uniref:Uncharacterized protein n=1 Tax=Tuber borchii TaxID=42251 RepID=A0A2T7A207_TUBBO|nr:hypothetical protein B9Z19DRAFT_1062398 [Tuber borchii]
MPTPTIDQMIYALSEMGINYRYYPPERRPTNPAISKGNGQHLKMLSFLSLLIIPEGSGDIAAVSLHATAGKRNELCYSKNRPCTPDETAYITELFRTATDPTSSARTKLTELFSLVLCKCKDKIIARLHKLCNPLRALAKQVDFSFVTLNPQPRVAHNPVATQCDTNIRKLVGTKRFPLDSSLADFLKRWFQLLLSSLQHDPRFNLPENKRLVSETITISYLLAQEPQAASILDIALLRPVRKLGDYYAAISVLVKEITKLTRHGCGIIPPPPGTQFSGDFLAILNECARDHSTTEITRENLNRTYYEPRKLPKAPVAALRATIHCECSLALAFAKSHLRSPVPTILEIGISKFPCWFCREFLASIHDSYPHITFHVPPYSDKVGSGWTLPPGAPSKVVKAMCKGLQDVINEVLIESVINPAYDSDDDSDGSLWDGFYEYIKTRRNTA